MAALLRSLAASVVLFSSYAALLCAPQGLFPFAVSAGGLTMYSDRPIPEASGKQVLELAVRKLARSPLYSVGDVRDVYVCNSRWRQLLFFNRDYGVGGVAPYPVTPNVFLRDARIEDNRLVSRQGIPVAGDRSLDYYVAHELTHQLTGRMLGPLRYWQLPQWVREGYADYVGKGDSFNYFEAKRAFLDGTLEMDPKRSGLYRRFHLLVAYLLDHQKWSVERLLNLPPPQAEVEAAVRVE
jgi:hypothetical protein